MWQQAAIARESTGKIIAKLIAAVTPLTVAGWPMGKKSLDQGRTPKDTKNPQGTERDGAKRNARHSADHRPSHRDSRYVCGLDRSIPPVRRTGKKNAYVGKRFAALQGAFAEYQAILQEISGKKRRSKFACQKS